MKRQGGFALVHLMVMCSVMVLLAVAATSRGSSLAIDNRVERAQLRARLAAEGGLATARHAMREKATFEPRDLRIGHCTVHVEVRLVEAGQWEIVARASAPTRGTERCVVTLRSGFGRRAWYRESR